MQLVLSLLVIVGLYGANVFADSTHRPLDKIKTSELSNFRYHIRLESELNRCFLMWQAMESQLVDDVDWSPEENQKIELDNVDLSLFADVRDMIKSRTTHHSDHNLVFFFDLCIRKLNELRPKEKQFREHDDDEYDDDDESDTDSDEISKADLEEENEQLLDELERVKRQAKEDQEEIASLKRREQVLKDKLNVVSTREKWANRLYSQQNLKIINERDEFKRQVKELTALLEQLNQTSTNTSSTNLETPVQPVSIENQDKAGNEQLLQKIEELEATLSFEKGELSRSVDNLRRVEQQRDQLARKLQALARRS